MDPSTIEGLKEFESGNFLLKNSKTGTYFEGVIKAIEIRGSTIHIDTSDVKKLRVLPIRWDSVSDMKLTATNDYKPINYEDGRLGLISQSQGELIVLTPPTSAS